MLDLTPEAVLLKLKAERAELARLAAEDAPPPVPESSADRRAKIGAKIAALSEQEHSEFAAWLNAGRQGDRPAPHDSERSALFDELAGVPDDDQAAREAYEAAQRRQQEYSRAVVVVADKIEEAVHAQVVERIDAALAVHGEALERVSITLAVLSGLHTSLTQLSFEHGRTHRPELERAVLAQADRLADRKLVEMRQAVEAATAAQEEFARFMNQLRA